MNQHAASVRDYQFYLDTRPTPLDKRDVQQELNKMIDDKKAQTKKEASTNNYYFRKEQQKNSNTAPPPPPPPNFKHPSYKTQYAPRTNPASAPSSQGAGKFSWQEGGEEDEDASDGDSEGDRFQYFKVKYRVLHKFIYPSTNMQVYLCLYCIHLSQNYTDFYSKRNGHTGDGSSSAGGSSSGAGASGPKHGYNSGSSKAKPTNNNNYSSSSNFRPKQQEYQQPPPPPPPKGNRPGGGNYNGQRGGSRRPVSDDDDDPDHYKILGISSHATEREVKTAYRKLALQFHPDKNKEPGAEDKFKTVTSSYAILSDKVRSIFCQYMNS